MKDIIKVSVVSFNAKWGDKAANLGRILGYIEAASGEGSNLIVFPEMALTGYDNEEAVEKPQKMQSRLAETATGDAASKVAELTSKLGVYAAFGMPESSGGKVYNSVCVTGPNGLIGTYKKIHLPAPEPAWASRGDKPLMFDTAWGPIGVGICYDSYCFQELMRYYAAKGARLYINCTALAKCHGIALGSTTLEAAVITNQIYIASANLAGLDLYNVFWGGASIIGPSTNFWEAEYFAGYPFTDPRAIQNKMYTSTLDLSLATRQKFEPNALIGGKTDYRPAVYKELMDDLLKDKKFQE